MVEELEKRILLIKTLNELRNSPPVGAIGLIEFRNILFGLFPEISNHRDNELDDILSSYVTDLVEKRPEHEWENRKDEQDRI